MLIDKRSEFSVAQALTATAASTSFVDLGEDRDIGVGQPLFWITELPALAKGSASDETYVAELQTDDNTSFSSPTTILTQTITRLAAAGSVFVQGFPYANERYLRVNYTLGGTLPSVTVNSRIQREPPKFQSYPAGTTQTI
jgi:hypothetical protein